MLSQQSNSNPPSSNNIKSICQLHLQMVQKKKSIAKQFQQLLIPSLSQNLDYQTDNITFDKIFAQIPSEQKLKDILVRIQNREDMKDRLKSYHGPYDLVKKAASRADSIKPQAKQMYCLFAQLNLPKIKQDFKLARQKQTIKLSSYQLMINDNPIKQQKIDQQQKQKIHQRQASIFNPSLSLSNVNPTKPQSIKATKFQRNTISQQYLFNVKQLYKYDQILPPNQYLKDDDLLIHVCIYESLGGEKQHQFMFLGDMKLIDVKKEIYCKFQKLQKQAQLLNGGNSNGLKRSNEKNIEDKSFFLIQQNLYYQGTHHSQYEIDTLIKNIKVSYQTDLYKFSMNNAQLKNLRVVFGRPYLFRHMGGCDHTIVFKDIRLFDKNGIDPDIKKKYPFMVFESKMKKKKCQGCDQSFANFLCVGDMLKNGQISYLCKQCHLNIHNDLTNTKNKFMKILPYIHQ